MGSADGRAGKPGPEPLFEQRVEFARLICLGVSNEVPRGKWTRGYAA